MTNSIPEHPEEEDEIILITRFEWEQVQARYTATNTRFKWLVKQIASMHASHMHPANIEARVACSRTKYRELLELLGYPIEDSEKS